MSKSVIGFAFALGVIGCSEPTDRNGTNVGPVNDDGTTPDMEDDADGTAPDAGTPPDTGPAFGFFGSFANGDVPPLDTYDAEELAYINAEGVGAVPGNYSFEVQYFVYPPSGSDIFYASTDGVACRTFHVNSAGQVDQYVGATDASCSHQVGLDASSGSLTIQVSPFDITRDLMLPDAMGRFVYNVRIAPEGESFLGDTSTGFTFYVKPAAPPAPVCGDGHVDAGEDCDDGNSDYNDGCSATCRVEHLCCCGNGVVEPGEQCDDGNHHDGDSCSSTCQL